MKLIVGLGNPGKEYVGTRHNLGFRVVERVGSEVGGGSWRKKTRLNSKVWVGGGGSFMLVEPQTYMNNSGEAVGKLLRYYRLNNSDLWVVYDDVELPLGEVKIQPTGKRANHNGVQSVVEVLGTSEFARFRVGVGWDRRWPKKTWVLSRFTQSEEAVVEQAVRKMALGIKLGVEQGITKAMNELN